MEHRTSVTTPFQAAQASTHHPYDELPKDVLVALMDQEAVAIAIVVGDDLHVDFANDAFWRLFAPRSDEQTATLPDLAPGGVACGLFDALRRSHQGGRMQRHEYRIDIKDDARLWDATMVPLPHPVNDHVATLLQIIDLTDANHLREERNRLHSLAEQRAEQFAIAAESIDNGIVVIDKDGRVRRINSVGIALLDLDDQHADGSNARAGGAARRQIDLPPLHLALRGHSVRDYEHCIARRDGQQTWLNVSSFPLYDQRGTVYGAMAAIQDVSERRQINQIKEDFLSVTAHELRTPVTSLLGYTNLLVRRAEHGDWNDRDLHAIRMIETQVQRLTQLINGLVDVSRVQAGALELHAQPVELHALAQQAAALIRPKAPDHLLVVEGPAEPVVVGGDPQRLDQIVSHLIENALKFSPWGGTITVRVWGDEEAHVSVADVGIGIPEEAIGQLFERFYRAANVDPERISGLGVGLYLVKELVAAHGGRIEVQSAPDHGTTFEIILPLQASYEADILRDAF